VSSPASPVSYPPHAHLCSGLVVLIHLCFSSMYQVFCISFVKKKKTGQYSFLAALSRSEELLAALEPQFGHVRYYYTVVKETNFCSSIGDPQSVGCFTGYISLQHEFVFS
jgi:hypothetical protein